MFTQPADHPFTQRKELKAHQLEGGEGVLVTVVDVNAREGLIRRLRRGFYARCTTEPSLTELSHSKAGTWQYGRRIAFTLTSHKPEAPRKKKKFFSVLLVLPVSDNRDGTKTECTGVLTCTCGFYCDRTAGLVLSFEIISFGISGSGVVQ